MKKISRISPSSEGRESLFLASSRLPPAWAPKNLGSKRLMTSMRNPRWRRKTTIWSGSLAACILITDSNAFKTQRRMPKVLTPRRVLEKLISGTAASHLASFQMNTWSTESMSLTQKSKMATKPQFGQVPHKILSMKSRRILMRVSSWTTTTGFQSL